MDESALSQWFRVLGYGNPEAALWFVGIEPGAGEKDDFQPTKKPPNQRMEKYLFQGAEYLYDKDAEEERGKKVSRAWSRPLAFARAIFGLERPQSLKSDSAWKHCMLSNLAPLPRPTEKHLLGVDVPTYRQRVRDERIRLFTKLVTEGPARAMVVHGKGAASIYGAHETLGHSELEEVDNTGGRVRYRRVGGSVVAFCHSLTRARTSDVEAVRKLVESVKLGPASARPLP